MAQAGLNPQRVTGRGYRERDDIILPPLRRPAEEDLRLALVAGRAPQADLPERRQPRRVTEHAARTEAEEVAGQWMRNGHEHDRDVDSVCLQFGAEPLHVGYHCLGVAHDDIDAMAVSGDDERRLRAADANRADRIAGAAEHADDKECAAERDGSRHSRDPPAPRGRAPLPIVAPGSRLPGRCCSYLSGQWRSGFRADQAGSLLVVDDSEPRNLM